MEHRKSNAGWEDLQPELRIILNTVLLVEEKYGANYLNQLLRGDSKHVSHHGHTQLPAFGSFSHYTRERLRQIFHWCTENGWLKVTHKAFGCLGLTDKARGVLRNPFSVPVRKQQLLPRQIERRLLVALRQLRLELARVEEIPVYRVFNDQTLQALIKERPQHLEALQAITGMGDHRTNRYGGTILMCIGRVMREYTEVVRENARKKAEQSAQRTVKALFESGFELKEIAEKRKVKINTVIRSLETLHLAEEVGLKEWIEEQVAAESLAQGSRWFQDHTHSSLKEAYESLGLDYETLRMCRLYVSKFNQIPPKQPYSAAS